MTTRPVYEPRRILADYGVQPGYVATTVPPQVEAPITHAGTLTPQLVPRSLVTPVSCDSCARIKTLLSDNPVLMLLIAGIIAWAIIEWL